MLNRRWGTGGRGPGQNHASCGELGESPLDKEAAELSRPLGVGNWLAACAGKDASRPCSVPRVGQGQLQPDPSMDTLLSPTSTPAPATTLPHGVSSARSAVPCCPQSCLRHGAGWRTPTLGHTGLCHHGRYRLCRSQCKMKMQRFCQSFWRISRQ